MKYWKKVKMFFAKYATKKMLIVIESTILLHIMKRAVLPGVTDSETVVRQFAIVSTVARDTLKNSTDEDLMKHLTMALKLIKEESSDTK